MSGMGLSLSELCCLFCCPPFPSKIAAKLAFLPPEPTYSLEDSESETKLVLNDRAEWQYSQREQESLEVFYTRTSRGNKIACMFVRCSPNARFTILHSHGNAVDLGQMSSFYMGLGSRINCNIFRYVQDSLPKQDLLVLRQIANVLEFQEITWFTCDLKLLKIIYRRKQIRASVVFTPNKYHIK